MDRIVVRHWTQTQVWAGFACNWMNCDYIAGLWCNMLWKINLGVSQVLLISFLFSEKKIIIKKKKRKEKGKKGEKTGKKRKSWAFLYWTACSKLLNRVVLLPWSLQAQLLMTLLQLQESALWEERRRMAAGHFCFRMCMGWRKKNPPWDLI